MYTVWYYSVNNMNPPRSPRPLVDPNEETAAFIETSFSQYLYTTPSPYERIYLVCITPSHHLNRVYRSTLKKNTSLTTIPDTTNLFQSTTYGVGKLTTKHYNITIKPYNL